MSGQARQIWRWCPVSESRMPLTPGQAGQVRISRRALGEFTTAYPGCDAHRELAAMLEEALNRGVVVRTKAGYWKIVINNHSMMISPDCTLITGYSAPATTGGGVVAPGKTLPAGYVRNTFPPRPLHHVVLTEQQVRELDPAGLLLVATARHRLHVAGLLGASDRDTVAAIAPLIRADLHSCPILGDGHNGWAVRGPAYTWRLSGDGTRLKDVLLRQDILRQDAA